MKFLTKLLSFLFLINFSIYHVVSHNVYEFDDEGFIYVNEPDKLENQIAELKLIIRSRAIFINRIIQKKIDIKNKLNQISKKISLCNVNSDDVAELKNQTKNLQKRESELIAEIKEETNRLDVLCEQLEKIYILLEFALKA